MKLRLIIFLAVALLFAGGGYLAFVHFVQEEPEPAKTAASPSAKATGDKPSPAQDKPPEPDKSAMQIKVSKVEGRVSIKRPEKDWQEIDVGDLLMENDMVKTGRRSRLELSVGAESTASLNEHAELEIQKVSRPAVQFKLRRGKVDVKYSSAAKGSLQFKAEGSDTVARTVGGNFSIFNTSGIVSVATATGEVKLTAEKKTVTVASGQQSIVMPGKAPRKPSAIPLEVFLRIARAPERNLRNKRFVVVTGRVTVGAEVRINGIFGRTDLKGNFKIRVPLREGKNRLRAVVRDVSGHVKTKDLGTVEVELDAPVDEMQMKWE